MTCCDLGFCNQTSWSKRRILDHTIRDPSWNVIESKASNTDQKQRNMRDTTVIINKIFKSLITIIWLLFSDTFAKVTEKSIWIISYDPASKSRQSCNGTVLEGVRTASTDLRPANSCLFLYSDPRKTRRYCDAQPSHRLGRCAMEATRYRHTDSCDEEPVSASSPTALIWSNRRLNTCSFGSLKVWTRPERINKEESTWSTLVVRNRLSNTETSCWHEVPTQYCTGNKRYEPHSLTQNKRHNRMSRIPKWIVACLLEGALLATYGARWGRMEFSCSGLIYSYSQPAS